MNFRLLKWSSIPFLKTLTQSRELRSTGSDKCKNLSVFHFEHNSILFPTFYDVIQCREITNEKYNNFYISIRILLSAVMDNQRNSI